MGWRCHVKDSNSETPSGAALSVLLGQSISLVPQVFSALGRPSSTPLFRILKGLGYRTNHLLPLCWGQFPVDFAVTKPFETLLWVTWNPYLFLVSTPASPKAEGLGRCRTYGIKPLESPDLLPLPHIQDLFFLFATKLQGFRDLHASWLWPAHCRDPCSGNPQGSTPLGCHGQFLCVAWSPAWPA